MIDLFEHNRMAYQSAVAMLLETGKAAVVHPTGTGKSFIGFKLCEEYPDKRICWLSPSEYIFKTQLENLRAASNGYEPENIVFFTYAKLMNLTEDELIEIQPDFIILDEFHRCGAEFWGQGVQNLLNQYPEVPILGLSATAVRYLDNQRDMSNELFDGNIASEMTLGEAIVRGILNPPKYVLSLFSYQKDLERYQKRVYQAKSRIVRDSAEKYLEALRRALEKSEGLDKVFHKHISQPSGKYLIFCADKEHMDQMIAHTKEWFGKIDAEPHVYVAYSNDPETGRAFSAFKADDSSHLKLLFCIDMLNEGVHVEDVAGVILFRPTVSPIVYKQQIGRAMSASSRKNAVIFDIVNNISNLYSIGAIREEMSEAVEYLRGNGEEELIVNETFTVIDQVRDCLQLFEQLESALVASWDYMYLEAEQYFKENGDLSVPASYVTPSGYGLGRWLVTQRGIYNGTHVGELTPQQIDRLNALGMCWLPSYERLWEEQFSIARSHFEATGSLRPPYPTETLKNWISGQRRKYNEKTLTEEKIQRLSEIGMVWDLDENWELLYRRAESFYRNNGHLDIPATLVTPDGHRLGQWYRRCVTEDRKGSLSPERKSKLLAIGYAEESVKLRTWMKYYSKAADYLQKNGNLQIGVDCVTEEGLRLGTWLASQRYQYHLGRLPQKRIELLNALSMEWQPTDTKWAMGFSHLKQYAKTNGNTNISVDYITADGFCLGAWVSAQRSKKALGKLSREKTEQLEALGVIWNTRDAAWEKAFAALETFQKQNGHLDVPANEKTPDGIHLKAWMMTQRNKFQAGKLDAEKVDRLNGLGFVWQLQKDQWETMLAAAEAYFGRYGNLSVPAGYLAENGVNLHAWIATQRKRIKAGKMEEEKLQRLLAVGFVPDPYEEAWERGYDHAKAYYALYGHLQMPDSYCTEDGYPLGDWLRAQRRAEQAGKLKEDRRSRLNALRFRWDLPQKRKREARAQERGVGLQ